MKRLFAAWRDGHDLPHAAHDDRKHRSPAPKRAALFARAPPDLAVVAAPVVYSSSSSDGSVVQTPEPDDDLRPAPPPLTTRWSSWIKPKSKPTTHVAAAVWEPPATPTTANAPAPPAPESDDDSDHYDEPEPPPRAAPAPAPAKPALQPATVLRAQMNLRALTLAALAPPTAMPPLVHLPGTPRFPRSANPARKLPRVPTTHIVLLKTALLRRLEGRTLSRGENESIAPFGGRPRRAVPKARSGRQGIDEEAVSDVNKKVRFYSRGLQMWLERPCFEDRCVLWTWDTYGREIVVRGVVGSGRAVASLEFSEGIEALGGYVEPAPPPRAQAQAPPKIAPLRISPPAAQEIISPGASTPNASTGPPTPSSITPLTATPRKILRFAEDPEPSDDEGDNVPLGFQVRGRRNREEAARIAEEQARIAEEKARQEERMRKVLAEEVRAARARREGSRAGVVHDPERVKDHRESFTRTAYDPAPLARTSPRRMASEPDSRSRPSSLSRPPSVTEMPRTKSRPASIRSDHTGTSSRAAPAPPVPHPPHLPRSSTMQTLEDEKRRRRASAVSEGHPPMPPMPSRTSLPPPSRTSLQPPSPYMLPPMPMMPMYPPAPGTPQFLFMQQAQAQAQMLMQMPLLPPVRPGLPSSRSLEGLYAPPPQPPASRSKRSSAVIAPSSLRSHTTKPRH